MTPEIASSWLRVFRNFATTIAAIFCFFYGPIRVHDPAVLGLILGAGAALLGTPLFMQADSRRRDDEGS